MRKGKEMEINSLGIEGAWLATSPVWKDDRGSFREWYQEPKIQAITGIRFDVQQGNISTSSRDVLRGIHYSLAQVGQAKWVTCISGAIRDVVVDIRPKSSTFGKYVSVDLVAGSGQSVLVGKGLGHGFASLATESTVVYLMTSPYSPMEEFEINPFDPEIGINWGKMPKEFLLSPKDAAAPTLSQQASNKQLPF